MKNVIEMYMNPPGFVKVFCRDCRYYKIFQRDGRRSVRCWLTGERAYKNGYCDHWKQAIV